MDSFDLLIVGGGINGAAIARDAAGRGLKVLLVEKDDLAAPTSPAPPTLAHGGLRYLERREFRLVRESLAEREILLRNAPHIVRPLRFVLPHAPGMRPWWTVRLGLLLYNRLAWRGSLKRSGGVGRNDPARAPPRDGAAAPPAPPPAAPPGAGARRPPPRPRPRAAARRRPRPPLLLLGRLGRRFAPGRA